MEEKTFTSDKLTAIVKDKKVEIPTFITPKELFKTELFKDYKYEDIIAAEINYKVTSLNQPLHIKEMKITPVLKNDGQSRHVYTSSFVFLLGMAVEKVVKEKHFFSVEYQFGSGIQCAISGVKLDEDLTNDIHACMLDIIQKQITIDTHEFGFDHAVKYFSERGRDYTVSLLKSKNDESVKVNTCGDYADLYFNPLVPHTGYILNDFDLVFQHQGLYLRYPKELKTQEYLHTVKLPKLYDQQNDWGRQQNASCVGQINGLVRENKGKHMKHFIGLCHTRFQQKVTETLQVFLKLNNENPRMKMILIAGPSASGKTTFSRMLCFQLESWNFKPVVISVDDYYKEDCPVDEFGNKDFETIDALRIDLFNKHLQELLDGKEIETPIFDFVTGHPKDKGTKIKMEKNSIIILEGIHCLNEKLTELISSECKFKIFCSPFSQLNIDEKHFVSNSFNRLVRRLVRDYKYRGKSASDTLKMWDNVRAGEHKNIFPFINNADIIFNSALEYEFCVLKVFVMPLLKGVKIDDPKYTLARYIIRFLDQFETLPDEFISPDSLLREFIGNSFFEDE